MALKNNNYFSKDQVNKIFPFNFEIGPDLKITSLGPSIKKIIGNPLGLKFSELFSIQRPFFKTVTWDQLKNNTNELILLRYQQKDILLRGQFEYLSDSNSLIFLGSQWVQSVEKLKENNLYIGDFAIHDPTFDLLHIIKTIEINSDEIKILLQRLKEKSDIIKKSEAHHKAILNMASEIIYRTNELGYFTYVNPAGEKITGYSSEELLKMRFTDLVRKDHKRTIIAKYARQIKKDIESTYHEYPIITKDGQEKWLGQSVQLFQQDRNIEFVALAIDITQQKVNEFALLESNKKLKLFQTLIDNTTDAIQVAKEDGQLVYLNIEASNRLGIPMDKVTDFYVTDFEKTLPTSKEWYRHLRRIRTKGPLILEGVNLNQQTKKTIPVEVTVGFFEINEVGYIIANSRDISQRKLIEESLRKQREKYQSIIANMNLGLVEVDLQERIQFVNPCFEQMSGYSKEELIGQRASNIFVDESNMYKMQDKLKQRSEGQSDMYEILIRNKSGEKKWWMISGAPNYNDVGVLIGSIGIHLDVTEAKQLELNLEEAKKRAEESSKAKEAFLANMSHEIRTPLNAIIGMIRELNKEKLTEKQAYYVGNTSVASQHLLSVLNNVLDISKIEAGELQIDSHDFDFRSILNEVKSIMIEPCLQKNLYFQINQLGFGDTVFIGDASRFRQILLNLVGNAVKFTERGGVEIDYKVTAVNTKSSLLEIVVNDTGVGMDQSYLSKIFNKFSQEDISISRTYGGSGLGMAITKELIQLLGGQIKIESKKNKGTSINLQFQLQNGKIENISKGNINLKFKEKIKVLLVEDNEFNRIVACNTLESYNCQISQATNGLEAINLLKKGDSFDVILMDLQMPIMDGFESTKIIIHDLHIKTPIIALTANAFKSELENCRKIGMVDIITKPFEESKLIETIYKSIHVELNKLPEPNVEVKAQGANLYNLDKLTKLFKGDVLQLNKMIKIFIDQVQVSLVTIDKAYKVGDLLSVYQQAHKIKPSVDGMGIISLKEILREIEKDCKENHNSTELGEKIIILSNTLNEVVKQLLALKLK